MATIVFTALGTMLGGPIGGLIGAAAGQAVDSSLFGGSVQGPRLNSLAITTSAYGSAISRHYGTMRVAGSIIWATNLVEHSQTTGGKGSPSVTTYTYTSSFAVALASRPIIGIGRIWADGNLLRGAAGDMKEGGELRIYTGAYDQGVDPLIAAQEGAANCPAFRGIAYVVFQDLQLVDFGNRIPNLSFEVFADTGELYLNQMFDGVIDNVDATLPLPGIKGFSSEGPLNTTLSEFQQVLPMDCDAGGSVLTISPQRYQTAPILLPEPAVSSSKNDFGGPTGYTRTRTQPAISPPRVLQYYDPALDYQAGSQRAPGQPMPGQPSSIQLPATITASDAFNLIAKRSRTTNWARETMAWRCAELDPNVVPGATVTLTGQPGNWRVTDWEWRETGIELMLERLAPSDDIIWATSAGRANVALDLTVGTTSLDAYELPWDGTGSADATWLFAAVSSASAGWKGAALYVDPGDGVLAPIGTSGRLPSIIGTATSILPQGTPLLFDRVSTLTVQLLASDMVLESATPEQMANGANRALVGQEIIQFANATSLGAGIWQLSSFLRGRGGTESTIGAHVAAESFVLLDNNPTVLDATLIANTSGVNIAALGLGDVDAVETPIINRGISLRPISPVHPVSTTNPDGSLTLSWTRRARGAWVWLDLVDTPLQEQSEAYSLYF